MTSGLDSRRKQLGTGQSFKDLFSEYSVCVQTIDNLIYKVRHVGSLIKVKTWYASHGSYALTCNII